MASMGVDDEDRLLQSMMNVSFISLFTSYCVSNNMVSSHCAFALLSTNIRIALLLVPHRPVIPR